jgi:hypothetical protein
MHTAPNQYEPTIKITPEWVEKNKTDAGGITAAQIMVFVRAGLIKNGAYKNSGWLKKIYGKYLTEKEAKDFFDARLVYAKQKQKNSGESKINDSAALILQLQTAKHELTAKPYWGLVMSAIIQNPKNWAVALNAK